jgi:hypothetical protein
MNNQIETTQANVVWNDTFTAVQTASVHFNTYLHPGWGGGEAQHHHLHAYDVKEIETNVENGNTTIIVRCHDGTVVYVNAHHRDGVTHITKHETE